MATLTPINFGTSGPTVESTPVAINGELFFAGHDSTHGTQLWEANPTTSATTMLTDLNVTHGGPNPKYLTAVGNTLFFVANDGTDGDPALGEQWHHLRHHHAHRRHPPIGRLLPL